MSILSQINMAPQTKPQQEALQIPLPCIISTIFPKKDILDQELKSMDFIYFK